MISFITNTIPTINIILATTVSIQVESSTTLTTNYERDTTLPLPLLSSFLRSPNLFIFLHLIAR